jgi:hypothetical protein
VLQGKEKKMFQALLTTFLWLALAPACYASSDVGNRSAFAHPPPVQQDVPSDTKITLLMTDCYGGCPVYSLTIYADGKVLYVGGEGVKRKGEVESRISQERLKELIAAFKKINYFDLEDRYVSRSKDCPSWATDTASAITSLTLNGKTKTVNHYYGCSGSEVVAKLTWLEEKINDAVNVNQWIE